MTKEIEFLEKQGYTQTVKFPDGREIEPTFQRTTVAQLLKQYADQETERLKAELSEKDAEIERLEQEKIMLERYCSKYESELTELKERHKLLNNILGSNTPFPLNEILKGLIESAHILLHKKDYDGHGWEHLEHCYKKAKDVNDLIEQYYKQKFEK